MAIPVYLQNFKHAGVYRVVFDKSQILNQDTNVLRLLVGYSDKGPFNIPTYIQSAADFIAMYGNINKTQERRGNFFHRTALQMLSVSPILCLNLKKFDTENVTSAHINSDFNVSDPIDTVQIPVEDVYDTTRFWTLDPEKLNTKSTEYINIATTDVKANSGTFFIRKASGGKVSAYNVTVSDWYKDAGEDVPEFLEGYENELMSAFFAEVYVFKGKFTADQVLASDTLKNYFIVDSKGKLKLRQYVKDSFGDYNDTLDYLYNDETSGAIGHYVGSLIPYFKDKNGNYASLDIIFNLDSDAHHMMMSFNEDMLYEDGHANIDLSGARWISTTDTTPKDNSHVNHSVSKKNRRPCAQIVCIKDLFDGTAATSLLGNVKAPVVTAKTHFRTNLWSDDDTLNSTLNVNNRKISGYLYVKSASTVENKIVLGFVHVKDAKDLKDITVDLSDIDPSNFNYVLYQLGAAYKKTVNGVVTYVPYKTSGLGSYYTDGDAYDEPENISGPKKVITSISRDLDSGNDYTIKLGTSEVKCNVEEVYITTKTEYLNPDTLIDTTDKYNSWSVYGPSVTFIPLNDNWKLEADVTSDDEDAVHTYHLTADANEDSSILSVLEKGDQFLAVDGKVDMDGDGDYSNEKQDGYYDLCYVQEVKTETDSDGNPTKYSIKFTGDLATYTGTSSISSNKIITADNYNKLSTEDKKKYQENTWVVTYKEIGPDTISAKQYNDLENKSGYNPSSIVFSKQVNAAEYLLLNDEARGCCTKNTDGSYTFVYNKPKPIISNEAYNKLDENGKKNYTVISIFGSTYYVEGKLANSDITTEKPSTININTESLKYDGTDKTGYYAWEYTNDAFESEPKVDADMSDATLKEMEANTNKFKIVNKTQKTYISKDAVKSDATSKYIVRIDSGLNQEIGTMAPVYLKGYTYEHPKPDGVGQRAKLDWQAYQLSALTEYKGLRTGLLNKSEIDFRYVIDGFESYVDAGVKKVLSYLSKEKQNSFSILNFPAVKTFVKCPYSSFTDAKGVFNVQYVVDGYNKKKAHTTAFSLPSNDEGASFAAFYTPLKLSDGTIDSVVPSAGLVSNLFMEKYNSRLPYEIVAGPNYGAMSVSGLVGPDYNYSSDELNIIEPFGVNCMVYRPSFGTFINANQTAKQTPKSALSSVNVRELVIYIMDEVEKILQAYQWEFNNQTVRNKIKDRADSICARVQANGGIQAYLNVMDDSNNTPDIIDNEMAILSTHIEPGRGMGKMVHELTLYRTGQMNSTILGE